MRLAATALLLAAAAAAAAPALAVAAPPSAPQEARDDRETEAERAKRLEKEAKEAAQALRDGLRAEDAGERRAALVDASETVHAIVAEAMAKALGDEDVTVRRTAIERLGQMDVEEALEALTRFARREAKTLADDVETHVELVRAIGRHEDADSIEWFARGALEGESVPLCRARVFALARLRSPAALDALVDEMKRTRSNRVRGRMTILRVALVYAAGTDRGGDPAAWTAWWHEVGDEFEPPEETPKLPDAMARDWRGFWGEARDYERRKRRGDRG